MKKMIWNTPFPLPSLSFFFSPVIVPTFLCHASTEEFRKGQGYKEIKWAFKILWFPVTGMTRTLLIPAGTK